MHFKFTSDNGLETIAKKSTNLYLTLGENRMTGKHNLELAISYKLTTGQRKTLKKKHEASMIWHLSLRYGHVTLVSGYSVLATVN